MIAEGGEEPEIEVYLAFDTPEPDKSKNTDAKGLEASRGSHSEGLATFQTGSWKEFWLKASTKVHEAVSRTYLVRKTSGSGGSNAQITAITLTIPKGGTHSTTGTNSTASDTNGRNGTIKLHPAEGETMSLLPVEIKVNQPDNHLGPNGCARSFYTAPKSGNARGLFCIWPTESAFIELKGISGYEQQIPITWNSDSAAGANQSDKLRHEAVWMEAANKKTVKVRVGSSFENDVHFNVADAPPWNEADALSWIRQVYGDAAALHAVQISAGVWNATNAIQGINSVKRDAVRHFCWSGLLTSFLGWEAASRLMGGHEGFAKSEQQERAYQTTMDNFNNSVGTIAGNAFTGNPDAIPDINAWISTGSQLYEAGALMIWYPYHPTTGNPVDYEKGQVRFSNGSHVY
jgi:hypothetical protein